MMPNQMNAESSRRSAIDSAARDVHSAVSQGIQYSAAEQIVSHDARDCGLKSEATRAARKDRSRAANGQLRAVDQLLFLTEDQLQVRLTYDQVWVAVSQNEQVDDGSHRGNG